MIADLRVRHPSTTIRLSSNPAAAGSSWFPLLRSIVLAPLMIRHAFQHRMLRVQLGDKGLRCALILQPFVNAIVVRSSGILMPVIASNSVLQLAFRDVAQSRISALSSFH